MRTSNSNSRSNNNTTSKDRLKKGRHQFSLGTLSNPKKGPRRSRNIIVSTLSGPAATCYPLVVTIPNIKKDLKTGVIGLRIRELQTKVSKKPVALIFIGKKSTFSSS
jgi:hypothetical protein